MKKALVAALAAILILPLMMSGGTKSTSDRGGLGNVPADYIEVLLRAGSVCDEIEPSLLAAQVEQESNWDPLAVSHAGAQGIAQFMPGTWAGSGLDGDGDGVADVFNPIDAIWSQGNFMCSLVSLINDRIEDGRLTGSVVALALAAYNAGLGNVDEYGGIPPFAETESYVPAILANVEKFLLTTAISSDSLTSPLPGRYVSSKFSGSRWHPIHGGLRVHSGTDIPAPLGTPILAAAGGTVSHTGCTYYNGNSPCQIYIDHGGGIVTRYVHMYPTGVFVQVGQQVTTGEVIGEVGNNGDSTGSHLHFEVRINGEAVDAEVFYSERGVPIT